MANIYVNSVSFSADDCLSTPFDNPKSKYVTSFTAYNAQRYLIEGVKNVNSDRWSASDNGSDTVPLNCGDDAVNYIDTKGSDYAFTIRYYGVSQDVVDGKIAPELTVK